MNLKRSEFLCLLQPWYIALLVIFMLLCTWGVGGHVLIASGAGAAVFLVGFVLRICWRNTLPIRPWVKPDRLTPGTFDVLRNLRSVSGALMIVGLCVLSRLLWLVPIAILYCLFAYRHILRHEGTETGEPQAVLWQFFLYCCMRRLPRQYSEEGHVRSSVLAELPWLVVLVLFVIRALLQSRLLS